VSHHVQLLVSRQRSGICRGDLRCGARCASGGECGREAHAGPRSPGRARHAGNVLLEVFRSQKTVMSPAGSSWWLTAATSYELRAASGSSQLLAEAVDEPSIDKTECEVSGDALVIVRLSIRGKLGATLRA